MADTETFRRNRACGCSRCRCSSYMGPAVLVTLGVLFLIGELSPFRFHNTWPVLLIVIGVVKVLQWSSPPAGHIGPDYPGPPGPTVLPPQPPSTTDPQVPRV